MATQAQVVTLEEYFDKYAACPDRLYEYDDGQLIEKPMPDWLHGLIVQQICYLLRLRHPLFGAAPELDSKVAPTKIRKPDIAVARLASIHTRYAEEPLYLAIEVLSPSQEKRFPDMVTKCELYRAWGVPHCWILDPHTREAWHGANEFRQPVATLEAGEIRLLCAEIFAVLEQLPAADA